MHGTRARIRRQGHRLAAVGVKIAGHGGGAGVAGQALTGLARATIYQQMATGRFPRPVKVGKRAVAWPKSAINDWIEERKAEAGFGDRS